MARALTFSVLSYVLAACGLLPEPPEAPEECGFPHGTELSFDGRATTGALGVNEVSTDPMQDDPADIYITRDEFDQGERRGRLVCAIYVNPRFLEITMVPEKRQPPPDVVATEAPAPATPPAGLTPSDAIASVRAAVPNVAEWEVVAIGAGPITEMIPEPDAPDWAHGLDPDRWVWRVFLVSGDQGSEVFIDFENGSLLGVMDYIVNWRRRIDAVGHAGGSRDKRPVTPP